jgi:HD-like signal output (HDOD) protein
MRVQGRQGWVNYLDKVELPILSKTIKSIAHIGESDEMHIDDLVSVILQDADLTSKVIKLANSATYNPMRVPTDTMSRAIVQVGFESVRSIAISSALVDQLTRKSNQKQLFDCLVRSFHAAVQAKYLAADLPSEIQESIFIAALLYDVGEAAFWSSSARQTELLERMNLQSEQSYLDTQKEVLGTSFKSISRGLVKCWGLGKLLEESLTQPSSRPANIVCAAVDLAHKHDHGWDKSSMTELLPALTVLSDKSSAQISKDLYRNAEQAAKLAEQFGIKGARSFLQRQQPKKAMTPNPEAQFEALLKISEYLTNPQQGIEKTLGYILECAHRTVGLERVAIFLIKSKSQNSVIWKFEGKKTFEWQGKKSLYLKEEHPIRQALNERTVSLLDGVGQRKVIDDQIYSRAPFESVIPALVMPIWRDKTCLGFVYADRVGEHPISRQQLSSFRLFAQQIQLGFDSQH